MVVFEQLLHHVERLAAADGKKIAPVRGLCQQGFALGLRQRLGITFGNKDARGDLLGAPVPVAEGVGVAPGEPRHIGNGFLAVAAEYQCGAVAVRLAELVARRDVGDTLVEPQVVEPRRIGNMEMIDGMRVVIEAGCGDLPGRKAAAILQAAIDQQDLQAGFGEVAAEDQAVMSGADDDPVIGPVERPGHRISSCRAFSRNAAAYSRRFVFQLGFSGWQIFA